MTEATAEKPKVTKSERAMNIGGMHVRCTIFKVEKAADDVPVSNVADPFQPYYVEEAATGEAAILQPPYNMEVLAQVNTLSNMLMRCVTAYCICIDGLGHQYVKAKHLKDKSEEPKEMQAEIAQLQSLFDLCNPDQNMIELRKALRRDFEMTGMAYMEVVRNRIGEIAELYRIPSHSCRLTSSDKAGTVYEQNVRDMSGKFAVKMRNKKFRRVVQYFGYGDKVYFKEFGDPRDISLRTGKPDSSEGGLANEVIVFKNEQAYGHYGIPRWMGSFLGIVGSRKADEVNVLFFDNKTIPPMVISVSGGQLTDETLEVLRDTIDKELKGVDNFHKTLILEAIPHSGGVVGDERLSPVKIDIQPLTQYIQSDATFQGYKKNVADDVRKDFRLPPLFIGASEEYNRATALESVKVAENQVFKPERDAFDTVINRTILADMQINSVDFESNGLMTADHTGVLRAIGAVKEAASIGTLMDAIQDALGEPKRQLPEELYDLPMALLSQASKLFPSLPEPDPVEIPPELQDKDDPKKLKIPKDADDEDVEKFVQHLFKIRHLLKQDATIEVMKGK